MVQSKKKFFQHLPLSLNEDCLWWMSILPQEAQATKKSSCRPLNLKHKHIFIDEWWRTTLWLFWPHWKLPSEVKNQGIETLIVFGICDMTTLKPEWTFSSSLKDNFNSILMALRVFKETFHFPLDTLVETERRERHRSFGFFISSLLHHCFPCVFSPTLFPSLSLSSSFCVSTWEFSK